jgi:hypothetical protein
MVSDINLLVFSFRITTSISGATEAHGKMPSKRGDLISSQFNSACILVGTLTSTHQQIMTSQ